jgi:6-pyruvoyltetrahydropterin/6-carboxytetrahydropterin synthase
MEPSLIVSRTFEFAAAHRLKGHESKCRHLHGHNYTVITDVASDTGQLDALGRVIDFGEIKRRIGGWLDEHWDHGMILATDDDEAFRAAKSIADQKIYLLDGAPTAENLALHLLTEVTPRLLAGSSAHVVKVTVWETSNSKAVASTNGG